MTAPKLLADPSAGSASVFALLAAVRALIPLVRQHQLIVTHGDGPQVGALAQP